MSRRLQPGANRLPRIRLAHASGASAELYLHGAHLTSWIPAGGAEALFLSQKAVFRPGSPIRGGIPVVFPQFSGLGPLPKHGFARVHEWEWTDPEGEGSRATLELRDSPETRALWPHAFRARLTAELEESSLSVRFSVTNTDAREISFTTALHSYLRVEDAARASVEGLRGVRYRSKPEGVEDLPDPGPTVEFAGEVDRVYLDVPPELRLHDRAGGRTLRVGSSGFRDAVVWNPGAALAATLPDLAPEEYRRMVCVEAAQVGRAVEVAAGGGWSGGQRGEVVAAR